MVVTLRKRCRAPIANGSYSFDECGTKVSNAKYWLVCAFGEFFATIPTAALTNSIRLDEEKLRAYERIDNCYLKINQARSAADDVAIFVE